MCQPGPPLRRPLDEMMDALLQRGDRLSNNVRLSSITLYDARPGYWISSLISFGSKGNTLASPNNSLSRCSHSSRRYRNPLLGPPSRSTCGRPPTSSASTRFTSPPTETLSSGKNPGSCGGGGTSTARKFLTESPTRSPCPRLLPSRCYYQPRHGTS